VIKQQISTALWALLLAAQVSPMHQNSALKPFVRLKTVADPMGPRKPLVLKEVTSKFKVVLLKKPLYGVGFQTSNVLKKKAQS